MKGLRKRVPNKRLDPERIKRALVLNGPERQKAGHSERGPWQDSKGRLRISMDALPTGRDHSKVLDGNHLAQLALGE